MRRADSTFRHFGERNRQSRRSGFSFVECAISLLFTSVVILGALNAVSSTHRARAKAG